MSRLLISVVIAAAVSLVAVLVNRNGASQVVPYVVTRSRREFLPLKSVWKLVLPSSSLLSQPAIAVRR